MLLLTCVVPFHRRSIFNSNMILRCSVSFLIANRKANAPIDQRFPLGWRGRGGNPRELDFVKSTWVGILTSTTVPRVGNLTQPPYWIFFL